jgi:hypothetical protein
MHTLALFGVGRAVGGGADERMGELDAPGDLEQPRVRGGVRRSRVQTEGLGGTVQEERVAERLGGGGEDEESRLGGESREARGRSSARSWS